MGSGTISSPLPIFLFNQQSYCVIIIDLLLADAGRPELLQALRRAYHRPARLHRGGEYDTDSQLRRGSATASLRLACLAGSARAVPHYPYTLLDHLDREDRERRFCAWEDFEIDLMRRRVFIRGSSIKLSGKEYDLFCFFVRNLG